jgi:hypothetical protein
MEVRKQGLMFHLIVNAYWEQLDFELPALRTGPRSVVVFSANIA